LNPVKIGFLGFGTVGQGAAVVLARNAVEINRRAGRDIIVKSAAVRDVARDRAPELADVTLTTNHDDIVNDPEIDVVIEVMGGDEPARTLILKAIENGKHVVTANKALVAVHGEEIFEAARQHRVSVAFEAAVAGGIPVIKSIREGLAGNKIQWLAGIINGTSNYILTEMRDKGRDFPDVITQEDTVYAEELGYRIKHVGLAVDTGNGIELRVHPALLPERRLIANVDGVMNAVLVQADAVGPTLYYGAGAGAEPTGSSVVADVMDVVRVASADVDNRVPVLAFQHDAISDFRTVPSSEFETSYYLRILAEDVPGVMADISRILADQQINIEAIIQKEPASGSSKLPIVLLTKRIVEGAMDTAIAQIEKLRSVEGAVVRIRVESLG